MKDGIKAAAIIAEYNPFHNGHALHIRRTRELYGATHIVAVMSGDVVQRGECACVSKWTRTRAALCAGADLVVELPPPWSAAGAERFALGGATLSAALGCVRMLSFGSECGDVDRLRRTAAALDGGEMKACLDKRLATGATFAAARCEAVCELYAPAREVLTSPNDTLGVEYCRALNHIGADIEPVCVLREGVGHDCTEQVGTGNIASASHIRALLSNGAQFARYIPADAAEPLIAAIAKGEAPALMKRLDRAGLLLLRGMDAAAIGRLPDISEGLENRIYASIRDAVSLEGLCDAVKTKRYTHARIRRIVLAALLGMTAADCADTPCYIRVLGMNGRGRELLGAARPNLPVVTRYADLNTLGSRERRVYTLSMCAADLLGLATEAISPRGGETTHAVVVFP